MPVRADRFDQLTGAFDDPIAPRPAFAARLRAQVLAELAESPHQIASTPNGRKEPIMLATVANLSDHPTRRLRQGTRKGKLLRPRWTRTTALLNVAAILLLLVGIARFFAPQHPAPDSTYRLPAIASQPSNGLSTPLPALNGAASMWGANPAQTWNMGATTPDVSGWQPTIAVKGAGSPISAAIIHRGVLYLSLPGAANGGKPQIRAVDITSGRTLWTAPMDTYGRMAATDDSLYVLQAISNPDNKSYFARLAALNARTGKVRWEMHGHTFAPLPDSPSVGPIIDGNRIYLGTPDGHVLVVDPQAGALLATLGPNGPIDFAARDATTGDAIPILPGGSVAADQNSIYTVLFDGTLAAYDANRMNLSPFTQQWDSAIVASNGDAKVIAAQVMVSEGTVVVLATSGVPTGNMSSPYQLITRTVTAYDAPHGIRLWSHELSGGGNRMTIAAGNVVVSLGGTGGTPARVAAYNLRDGSDRWNVSGGLGNDPVWLSAAGDAVFVLNPQGKLKAVRAVEVSGGNAIKVQDLPDLPVSNTFGDFVAPLTLDGGVLYAIGGDGTLIRFGELGTTATPAASPSATPETSSVAVQPGANPGQTNQYDVSIGTPKRLNLLGEARPAAQVGAGPIVSDGTLYRIDEPTGQAAANASTVSAVSLVDGSARTVFSDPAHNADAVMMRGDQLLVVANPVIGTTTNAALIAVDPATGHALWSLDLFAGPAAEAKPLLAGNMVFVADQSGKVYGIDLTAHRVTWSALVSSLGEPPELLAADDSLLYVVNGFDLSAIDQATGATRWQADLSRDLLGITSITVGGGHIIVGGPIAPGGDAGSATPASAATPEGNLNESRVLAISAKSHTVEWHWDMPDHLSNPFVIADGKVIVGHGQGPFGNATALDLATGKVAWQINGAAPVFADRDQVVAVTLQVSAAPGTRLSTPATSGRVPIFQKPPETVTSVTLLGIDPATGTTQWVQGENLGIGNPVVFLPIDQGVVILLSSGQVVVLRD